MKFRKQANKNETGNLSTVRLNVGKVLADFQKSEKSTVHRKGTFKIDAPFEEALDTILKPSPQKPHIDKK